MDALGRDERVRCGMFCVLVPYCSPLLIIGNERRQYCANSEHKKMRFGAPVYGP